MTFADLLTKHGSHQRAAMAVALGVQDFAHEGEYASLPPSFRELVRHLQLVTIISMLGRLAGASHDDLVAQFY